jgi:DNA-binding GntR family transcriptional regulator
MRPDQAALEDRTPTKAETVYRSLRRRIRELELPPGALLAKESIAAEFGVSRAPVSDAIARLTAEGLVDVCPQHGSFVAEIRTGVVREGMFIRMALETEVMRQVAQSRTPALLAVLDDNIAAQRKALAAADLTRFYNLDESLHDSIFAFADLPLARRFLDSARAQLDRVRRAALPMAGRPAETLREHARLVEAIRLADGEFAAAAMRAHLRAASESVEQRLAQYSSRVA